MGGMTVEGFQGFPCTRAKFRTTFASKVLPGGMHPKAIWPNLGNAEQNSLISRKL